jgi:predicted DNA repair protein MutK
LALLDDVAVFARVAAASLDDVAAAAGKAGAKAAGIVIDDTAVTPRYVVGFSSARELPIILKIALGSLRNKLLFLLPAALLLSWVAPSAITPILMVGGLYLAFEGAEKVYEALVPHGEAQAGEASGAAEAMDARTFEDQQVKGAIATDFILSAEIMAIALSTVAEYSFWTRAAVLALVGLGLTVLVYGMVALIVKADDFGVHLSQDHRHPALRAIGRGLVKGMPYFLNLISIIGTAAMIWVGGGIILHGLESFGLGGPALWVHDVAAAAGQALPAIGGFVEWLVGAASAGLLGLVLGGLLIPVVGLFHKPGAGAAH